MPIITCDACDLADLPRYAYADPDAWADADVDVDDFHEVTGLTHAGLVNPRLPHGLAVVPDAYAPTGDLPRIGRPTRH